MKQLIAIFAAAALPATAHAGAPIEGRWSNPRDSVTVEVAQCGNAYCGTVVEASPKARRDAQRGGTPNLIGTRLMTGFTPDGRGGWKGRIFLPKHNVHAGGQIRPLSANMLSIKGCAFGGLICKEQRWSRVR
ncbi:MAG: DUF2147 domain-containing protein [Sphingomicrobium sp.]